ncbi:MAG: glycine--tRNA ligase [Acidimicrobiia bacterium]
MTQSPNDPTLMDTIVNLCKRRGFVFPSSDIYGGFRSTWDFGPLGVLLKQNVKAQWFKSMVQDRDDIVGLDSAILMPPAVWEASGHLAGFTDPLVECAVCHQRYREDQLETDNGNIIPPPCPQAKGKPCELGEAKNFNLMFKTYVGPVEDSANIAYLRPETAQGIFLNFSNILNTTRMKPPFGIAQIGKSFRNEITPGNFIFRTREFEQMEMEFFVPPSEGPKWYEYWKQHRMDWYQNLGIKSENIRLREHEQDELSHYSAGTSDVEFMYPWGWGELEGIAQRTDFDLNAHSKHSGVDLSYFDPTTNERYVPYVIEPAAGCDRATLAFLLDAYDEDEINNEKRIVLRLNKKLAPYKAAILPLSKKEELLAPTQKISEMLRENMHVDVDVTQSIGKRYRRQDEIGTPYCITIDFDTLDDNAVTVRDRDTTEQQRIAIADLTDFMKEQYS